MGMEDEVREDQEYIQVGKQMIFQEGVREEVGWKLRGVNRGGGF